MALFTFVITTMNGAPVLPQCLVSIAELDYPRQSLEVVIVNNGSTDETRAIADSWAERGRQPGGLAVRPFHMPRNIGKSAGDSFGMRQARGDWVVLLNDDTELYPDWVRIILEEAAAHPGAGALGCILLYPDRKTIQHAGGIIRPNALTDHAGVGEEDRGQYDAPRSWDYVTAACMAVRRDVIEKVGLVDPGYWPIYFDEVDYCWRVHRGGYDVISTRARCIHHESRTTVAYSEGFLKKYHRNRLRFVVLNYGPRRTIAWARGEWRWFRDHWRYLPLRLLAGVYARGVFLLPGWLYVRAKRALGMVPR